MTNTTQGLCFDQLHIDVARNATDDFNPFHDPKRWQLVHGNPFGSTIVLGFQTEFLISDLVERRHRGSPTSPTPGFDALPYSNYDFRFVGALRPGEPFDAELRKTVDKTAEGGGLSTRALLRSRSGEPVLMGTQSETLEPKFLADAWPTGLPRLMDQADREPVPGTPYFLKRKFLTTSNGKNFVLAGLGVQHDYFDELDEVVVFPPLFTASLSSCGLLEQAWREDYDFHAEPLVYTSHQITVDRRLQAGLLSNDALHLLVDGPHLAAADSARPALRTYRVFGVVHDGDVLFSARMQLARLI